MSKDKNKDLIVDENLGLNTPKKEEIDEPVVNEEDTYKNVKPGQIIQKPYNHKPKDYL